MVVDLMAGETAAAASKRSRAWGRRATLAGDWGGGHSPAAIGRLETSS